MSLQDQKNDQAQIYLERSYKQLDKLNRLVTEPLDATKIESNKLKLACKDFPVATFLGNAISNIQ